MAAPDVDARHPLRSAVDLFHSKWWTIGWSIAVVASSRTSRLSLLPLSLAQAVLSGGFVLLAVLAERYYGFSLGRRQCFSGRGRAPDRVCRACRRGHQDGGDEHRGGCTATHYPCAPGAPPGGRTQR